MPQRSSLRPSLETKSTTISSRDWLCMLIRATSRTCRKFWIISLSWRGKTHYCSPCSEISSHKLDTWVTLQSLSWFKNTWRIVLNLSKVRYTWALLHRLKPLWSFRRTTLTYLDFTIAAWLISQAVAYNTCKNVWKTFWNFWTFGNSMLMWFTWLKLRPNLWTK